MTTVAIIIVIMGSVIDFEHHARLDDDDDDDADVDDGDGDGEQEEEDENEDSGDGGSPV